MVELTEITLYLPRLPNGLEGLQVLHVSDLHTNSYGRREKVLREVMGQGCDALLLTGDFCHQFMVSNPFCKSIEPYKPGFSKRGFLLKAQTGPALETCRKLLDGFSCRLGVYAIQGNHDPDDFMADLGQLDVTILSNETCLIDGPDAAQFNLCGIRGLSRSLADVTSAVLDMDPSLFTIGLCHFPEMAEPLAQAGIDLILAGHTHGGQICLPNRIPLNTHSQTGRKYATGLEHIGGSAVYTTRGLGCSLIPVRIFCPPEITRLTLHRGNFDQTVIESRPISPANSGFA